MGFLEVRVGAARVVFTDRHGGVSEPPYDTANLGLLTDDDPARVHENRRRVGDAVGGAAADPRSWFRIRQVHGTEAVVADRPGDDAAPEADAVVTAQEALPLTVLTADCAPVALVTAGAVGAVHAGWRGLVGGVVEQAVDALGDLHRGSVQAVIGPCIHPDRYAFGADDLDRIAARFGPGVRASTPRGEPALDLRAAVRAALESAGVTAVTDVDVCTAASPDHFSFRRDGPTGRQAMLVVREA
ncbi:MAG TPA: polyphenol oxidase family protein [Acidimicrobiia bacterium]|nr:polyphenol oxidase family protein [Acidimicrobiia bacterium]